MSVGQQVREQEKLQQRERMYVGQQVMNNESFPLGERMSYLWVSR